MTDRLRDLETSGVVERRLSDDGGAIAYALTEWGAQLREPIYALVRWSTPLMIRGPQGDEFHADWLLLALPALLSSRPPLDRSVAVGIVVDGGMVQLRANESGVEVGLPDGNVLDAVLTAEAPLVLGLAAGALSLDDITALIKVEGDESALRTLFAAKAIPDTAAGDR